MEGKIQWESKERQNRDQTQMGNINTNPYYHIQAITVKKKYIVQCIAQKTIINHHPVKKIFYTLPCRKSLESDFIQILSCFQH